MNQEQFFEKVRKEVIEFTVLDSKKYFADLKEVTKNNNIKLRGLMIKSKESKEEVVPMLYLNHFYKEYNEGIKGFENILSEIARTYMNELTSNNFPLKMKESISIENLIKEYIEEKKFTCSLINVKKNIELLKHIPHKIVCDGEFALIVKILVEQSEEGNATIKVTDEVFNLFHITQDEMFEYALENVRKENGVKYRSLNEIMMEMMPFIQETKEDDETKLIVLTNEKGIDGAIAILYEDILNEISDKEFKGNDMYILPSSVHEVILINAKDKDEKGLTEMVKEVNSTQVEEDEVLAEKVLKFKRATSQIVVA